MKRKHETGECAIVIGSYTNACSIIHGLKEIHYQHEIVVIDPTVNKAKCLTEVVFPDIKTIKHKMLFLDEIVKVINQEIGYLRKKIVFMTSEELIEPIRKAIEDGRLRNTLASTGSDVSNELIFDRYKFYKFVEKLGITNIPQTIPSNMDPFNEFGNQFIIRVNKSWEGSKKLPRLQIIHSLEEKVETEKKFIALGLTSDMWSYQELLSTVDTHNISVCGWYDKEYHQFVVTRKILQHPPKTGNGDVVEIFNGIPDLLLEQTEMILKALKYSGAFEMEYVLDATNGEYKLIELNPRYWMQHGLVEKITNYALIRRSLGEDGLNEVPINQIKHMYWINGTQAIYRLLKGQIGIVRYFKNGICVPSIYKAIEWGFYYSKYVKECNQELAKSRGKQ